MDNQFEFDGSEVDHVFELIITVFFMFIGAVGISVFVNTLYHRVQLEPRVDKVQVQAADYYGENYPFVYTGYQAYMFAWMMDGSTDDSLAWIGHKDTTMFAMSVDKPDWAEKNGGFIRLQVTESPAAFRVIRNRAIVGVEDFANANVRNTIKCMAQYKHTSGTGADSYEEDKIKTNCLYAFYNPVMAVNDTLHEANRNYVRLDFTAGEKCADSNTKDKLSSADKGSNHANEVSIPHHVLTSEPDEINTWRYKYEWILHPCTVEP